MIFSLRGQGHLNNRQAPGREREAARQRRNADGACAWCNKVGLVQAVDRVGASTARQNLATNTKQEKVGVKLKEIGRKCARTRASVTGGSPAYSLRYP